MKHYFNFYTSYNQFYLGDEGNKGDTGSSNFWTEKAFSDRLALENGVVGVGIQSWGDVKGEIEILENAPENTDYEQYDHVVEGGINIRSGELQIIDCPNGSLELSLKVDPGNYRIRVYGSNFISVEESDLANDTDNDYYRIEIWQSNDLERKVLKQYNQV
ncbi:hypothetical protein [Flavobacterium suzhouense]|uniref:Uncharacterized protein n=1 Tax=Flavobacterium suzhouense TaxID=1529638 RepID=A0ABW5NQP5_9FLAO